MKKRIAFNVLGLILLLICLGIQPVLSATAEFSLGTAAGSPGETVIIPLNFSFSGLHPCIFSVEINYDTSRLKFNLTSSDEGNAFVGHNFKRYGYAEEKIDDKTKQVLGVTVTIIEMTSPTLGQIPAGEIYKLGFDILPGAPAGDIAINFTSAGAVDVDSTIKPVNTAAAGIITVGEKQNTPPTANKTINHAPIAQNQTLTALKNTPINITLKAADEDKDSLRYRIVKYPRHGTLTRKMPEVNYRPKQGYAGTDMFTFIAKDRKLNSNTAKVDITVK